MAWIEFRKGKTKGTWRISFRLGDRRFNRSLKTDNKKEAESRRARLEENIRFVESGRLQIPDGADIAAFLLSDGKLSQKVRPKVSLSLSQLFTQFFDAIPDQSLEASTIGCMQQHRRHLERLIGTRFDPQSLTLDDLQAYVTKRAAEKGCRGRNVGQNTINKELVTFRAVWGWACETGRLTGEFPRKGIRLPKAREMPIFQTWEEIERQITTTSTDHDQADLWDCVYLTLPEIEALLKHVNKAAAYPFIPPMFYFAAYTGARRSEILRSQKCDIDLSQRVITLREKKRVRAKLSTRRVPLSPVLEASLRPWLQDNPGPHTFCHQKQIIKRSSKAKARANGPIALTGDEASHHFRQTLTGSKWNVLPGWHMFRHSFVSNCASKGIDQRMIDEWVGHTSEAMRRRYRHLIPSSQQDAMKLLFR